MSVQTSVPTTSGLGLPARPRVRRRLPRGRSDDALVARVRGGDDRAFELVFDRYHRGLLNFCGHMLGSREEAEDALQQTFMAAYRALRATDGPIRLKAWLYTIARNRCLSVLRARREHVAFDETRAPTEGLVVELDRRAELRGLLADLERLPDDQRAALVLFELGDHAHDEIAEILGVRREKVKALVFQARESLASWRRARETPCTEIREQLATLRGAALKRANLRRHVDGCTSCRDFEVEVRRQRAALALLLPIAPTAGLKGSVLSSILGGGATAAGAGTAASVAGLGAAKGLAAKTLLCAVVAGSAGSAGYVAVHDIDVHDRGGAARAAVSHPARSRDASATQRARRAQPLAPARASATVPIAAAATPATPATPHRAARPHGAKHGAWARGHRRRGDRAQRAKGVWRRSWDATRGALDRAGKADRGARSGRAGKADRRAQSGRAGSSVRADRRSASDRRVDGQRSADEQGDGARSGRGQVRGGGSRRAGGSPD